MKGRILVALMACVVGLSSCGDGSVRENGAAGDVERVKAALASLREARTATLTGTFVHSFLDSDIPKKVRTAFNGTYQAEAGAWADVVHAKVSDPDATGEHAVALDTWDLGDVAIGPNFVFERDSEDPPPLPWSVYDPRSRSLGPQPLTAFAVIGLATEARVEGRDNKDGVGLTRWTVSVPGEAAYELLGYGGYPGTMIDCRAGFPMTVWIDSDGRLRRFRLVIEQYNGSDFTGEFAFTDLGRPVDPGAALPPADQIEGSIDPVEIRAAKARRDQAPRREPSPCTSTDKQPTGVDRSACSPSSLKGFEMIDRLARTAPGQEGTLHYYFKEPTLAAAAFDVPAGLPVVTFGTKYIGPGGWELTRYPENGVPPGFDPTDQAAVRAVLSRPEHGEEAPDDVRLLSIALKGTWADLAVEASNCRYESATR